MDRKFIAAALGYAILGMALGIHMAASQDTSQKVTHAHILLVGFLLNFAYGLIHKLWVTPRGDWMEKLQFLLHQIGAAGLSIGLFLLYGTFVPHETIGPVLGVLSVITLTGMILMKIIFIRSKPA